MIVYINYFGQKGSYIQHLLGEYQEHLIVDDTQAFYQKGYKKIWSFNSARKFFGVPDGAYLYGPKKFKISGLRRAKPSWDHLMNRAAGNLDVGYENYKNYESGLTSEIAQISELSERILQQIDYEEIAIRRKKNYQQLHQDLKDFNSLDCSLDNEKDIPLYYPFLYSKSFHSSLAASKIFVPHLWPEILQRKKDDFKWEKELAEYLMPLPIDQRYDKDDMEIVVSKIKKILLSA